MSRLQQVTKSKASKFLQTKRWQALKTYLKDTKEGRQEISKFRTDLLYIAVEYRAPPSLIKCIYELLECEYEGLIQLERGMLLKALYFSSNKSIRVCNNEQSRKWKNDDLLDVANFLSAKVRT